MFGALRPYIACIWSREYDDEYDAISDCFCVSHMVWQTQEMVQDLRPRPRRGEEEEEEEGREDIKKEAGTGSTE